MTRRREVLPLLVTLLGTLGLPSAALGYEYLVRPALADHRVITVRAAVPGAGGFSPDVVRASVGETVTLRFRSEDVTHGIAIGPGLGVDLGQVDPGHTAEVTLTFDHPGTYTYYCNSWCSDDHWRMRGVIEVVDPQNPNALPTPQVDPVIAALIAEGVDIDAPHDPADMPHEDAQSDLIPSAGRGALVIDGLTAPADLESLDWRRSHTPGEALHALAESNPAISESDLADTVAYLWLSTIDPQVTESATVLYNRNCAACHGERGGGDGPAAQTATEDPVSFTDPAHMLDMRSDVLYAKIRRGGMGTDMPNFGTIFTPEETWALVDYLWVLAFNADRALP